MDYIKEAVAVRAAGKGLRRAKELGGKGCIHLARSCRLVSASQRERESEKGGFVDLISGVSVCSITTALRDKSKTADERQFLRRGEFHIHGADLIPLRVRRLMRRRLACGFSS